MSVIIPAYNEAYELPNLLGSLAPLREDSRFEVIVVDNGSTDDTSTLARSMGWRTLSIPRVAVGEARNVGASHARGTILAFLDADVVVTSTWIERVIQIAGSCSISGVLGDIYDIAAPPTWIELRWFSLHYSRGVRGYINGGNIVVSSSDFLRIGGFNPKLVSGEDFEFCQRAKRLGINVVGDRALHVIHNGYPKTALTFIRREIWHGSSDFSSAGSIARSSTAQATLLFMLVHSLLALTIVTTHWAATLPVLATIILFCATAAFVKWKGMPIKRRLAATPILYLYFVGRSLAALKMIARRGWRP